ncbi:MAG: type VI secretion system baseplate subunit TssG [Burkholderiaceae bacterium]|nr:type VI secretion system baseplate subunit TssG [Burkholderiaceae bacterium]
MQGAKRRFEPSVVQQLLTKPFRFEFFQSLRLLELFFKRHRSNKDGATPDFFRFKNRTALGFPASEIEAVDISPRDIAPNADALTEAVQKGELQHIALTPTFFGFLGGNGVLPLHYSEQIATHQLYEKDEAPRAFFDTFSNRAATLFYQAWRKYRLELKYELGKRDQFLPLLLSLAGLGQAPLRERFIEDEQGVLDQSFGFYSAAVMQRTTSASALQKILAEHFQVPLRIDQFVGQWYDVPAEQRSTLGAVNCTLGSEAMVGGRVWQRNLRMRVVIGPLDHESFERFLPGSTAALALEKMLSMFSSLCLEYEVKLVLRQQDVQGIKLGTQQVLGKLGWNSYLITKPAQSDRSDVQYELATV